MPWNRLTAKIWFGRIAPSLRVAIHHVKETAGRFIPELPAKAIARPVRQLLVVRGIASFPEALRQIFHRAQGVVPERLNLDRLSAPRRDHPVAHLGVHPGQLHSGLAGPQQAVVVHADSVSRAALMPRDDVRAARRTAWSRTKS